MIKDEGGLTSFVCRPGFLQPNATFRGLPSAPGICWTDDPLASILLLLMTKAIHFWDLILLFGFFDLQTVDPDSQILA